MFYKKGSIFICPKRSSLLRKTHKCELKKNKNIFYLSPKNKRDRTILEKLHQRRIFAAFSSCKTHQASSPRLHNQNPSLDFCSVIQGKASLIHVKIKIWIVGADTERWNHRHLREVDCSLALPAWFC